MLYIGMGDGGGGGDPNGNGQKKSTGLGKMLRIDVGEVPGAKTRPTKFRTPKDNPFYSKPGYAKTIWALGLRNPWRFSFDAKTGALWIADVGQGRQEEINYVGKGVKGVNYGWNRYEGRLTYPPGSAAPKNAKSFRKPIHVLKHPTNSSITGGYVYRGKDHPLLQGTYVYGDFVSGRIYFLRRGTTLRTRMMRDTTLGIASFGESATRELYLCDMNGGTIYKVGAKRAP
jgi:glucose/arabinose dehydrogenase